jgi:sugar/nucleoside kinase (ribokinase family)
MSTDVLIVSPAGYETVIYLSQKITGEFALASNVKLQGGGHGGNLAYYLAQMGVKSALYTHWGDDETGRTAESILVSQGVDTSLCRKYPGETSQSNFVLVRENGEKQVILNFGSALKVMDNATNFINIPFVLYTSLLPVKAAFDFISNARLSNSTVIIGLQLPSSVTSSLGLTHNKIISAFSMADFIIGNRSVLSNEFKNKRSVEDLCLMMLKRFPRLKGCIITDGPRGSVACYDGGFFRQKSFNVGVVDVTGAGDSFTAAFICYFLFKHMGIEQSLLRASVAGALCCGSKGARVNITHQTIHDFLYELGQE